MKQRMSPQSSSSGPAVDPVELLSQQMVPAAKKKGVIKLSSKLVKAVKAELKSLRANKDFVSEAVVVAIVSAFEEQNETCSRLDPATFAIILHVLLHAEYSRTKERGIVLLTASLHHDAHKTPPLRTIKHRKHTIRKDCLLQLLSCFTNTLENSLIRRWVGLLILQLLEGCDNNRMAFESAPEDSKRKLGTMVVQEQNEIVRMTCGQLLSALIGWNVPAQDLWPVGSDPVLYEKFPKPSANEKHWNNAFQRYVDDQFATSTPTQDFGRLYFAQGLDVRPMGIQIFGSTINVLVDREISICTQSTNTSFAESFEIPLQMFESGKLSENPLEGVIEPLMDLILCLKPGGESACYRNAVPINISEIRLTFLEEEIAYTAGEDILASKLSQKASQSKETIAVSQDFHDALPPEEHEVNENAQEEDLTNFYLEHPVSRPMEESQHDDQDVEFDNFIEASPKQSIVQETDTKITLRIGEPLPADIVSTVEPVLGKNQLKADIRLPLHSSAPARLSAQIGTVTINSVDESNGPKNDANRQDSVLKRALHPRALPENQIQKQIAPEPSSGQVIDEPNKPATSPVASPVASLIESDQPKAKPFRSKLKPKPKAKQKISSFESSDKDTKRVKKYSLKSKSDSPITKMVAPKRNTDPKIAPPRASLSKARTRVLAPPPDSAPKADLDVVSKASKKFSSKLLVPKKPSVKNTQKRSTRQPQANLCQLKEKLRETQGFHSSPERYSALEIVQGVQGDLLQGDIVTDHRTDRLSRVLASLDCGEQPAEPEELIQKSLLHKSPLRTTQLEGSSSPTSTSNPAPVSEKVKSPGKTTPKVTSEMSNNNPNHLTLVGTGSQSSPSSLERVSPVPLPAQEIYSMECSIPEAAIVPSEVLVLPTGPRRSPRLAARYNSREDSAAPSKTPVKVPRKISKPAVADLSGGDLPQYMNRSRDVESSAGGDASPLFDDHLARKTPLISFGAKGPLNQGIGSLKNYSIQRTKGERHFEEFESRPRLIQTYSFVQPGKRKRGHQDTPVTEDNKRHQASRLRRSKDDTSKARQDLSLSFHDADDYAVQRNHPVARKTARFGSQGSRVNENGSPRGYSNSAEEEMNYKVIVRKVLMDTKPADHGENDGAAFPYDGDDDEFEIDKPNNEISLGLPDSSSSGFKVRPLTPHAKAEVFKRQFPRARMTQPEHRKINTKGVCRPKLADPFLKEGSEKDMSSFAARLQYRRQTPTHKARRVLASPILLKTRLNMIDDPEITLVNVENEKPVRETSSSSDATSDSSDEDEDRDTHQAALESQQVECDEWKMTLKPHQRGILDVLNQVSSDLVRHLISHEQAAEDVLTEYEQSSTIHIKHLEKKHQEDRRRIQDELDMVKRRLDNEYRQARLEISRIYRALRAQPIRDLEKEWTQEQDEMQSVVEEGIRKYR